MDSGLRATGYASARLKVGAFESTGEASGTQTSSRGKEPVHVVSIESLFRHVRLVCGNQLLVRVAPDANVFGGEAVSGLMALSPRRGGIVNRALKRFSAPGLLCHAAIGQSIF